MCVPLISVYSMWAVICDQKYKIACRACVLIPVTKVISISVASYNHVSMIVNIDLALRLGLQKPAVRYKRGITAKPRGS